MLFATALLFAAAALVAAQHAPPDETCGGVKVDVEASLKMTQKLVRARQAHTRKCRARVRDAGRLALRCHRVHSSSACVCQATHCLSRSTLATDLH